MDMLFDDGGLLESSSVQKHVTGPEREIVVFGHKPQVKKLKGAVMILLLLFK